MKISTKMWTTYYMGGFQVLLLMALVEFKAPVWVFVITLGIALSLATFIFLRIEKR